MASQSNHPRKFSQTKRWEFLIRETALISFAAHPLNLCSLKNNISIKNMSVCLFSTHTPPIPFSFHYPRRIFRAHACIHSRTDTFIPNIPCRLQTQKICLRLVNNLRAVSLLPLIIILQRKHKLLAEGCLLSSLARWDRSWMCHYISELLAPCEVECERDVFERNNCGHESIPWDRSQNKVVKNFDLWWQQNQ